MAVSIPTRQTWLSSLNSDQLKRVQRQLNNFVSDTGLKGYAPLIVDGKNGQHTRNRVVVCKYFLGYLGKRDPMVNRRFMRRLDHPNWPLYSTPARIKRGHDRRVRHNAAWKKAHSYLPGTVSTFDGVAVASYFIPILQWCRANGWKGRLVSGYRTPEYSEHLCMVMCGAPRCPGRCAGRTTNHSGNDYRKTPTGAVDVSDYVNFRNIVARCPIAPRIFNALPNDLVHFSPHGN